MSSIEEEEKVTKLIFDIYEDVYNHSKDYYEFELLNWLSNHTLVVFEGKGIYSKKPNFLEPDTLISEHIHKLSLKNTEYEGRAVITSVCGEILDSIIKEFQELIKPNPIGYLICLLTFLERSVLSTFATFSWLHNKYRNGTEESNHNYEFGVVLYDSFSYLFENDNANFNKVFKRWEGYLGLNTFSFEMVLEIISDSLIEVESSSNEISGEKALEYARAIGTVIKLRDNANNKIFADQSLSITEEGFLQINRVENFEEKYNEFQEANIHWVVNKTEGKNVSKDNLDKINKVCSEYFGLIPDEITTFATSLLDFYNSNTWIISTNEIFPKTIQKFFNKDEAILKDFLLNLIREPIIDNDYLSVSKRIYRPLRKSLILFYKNWFICPSSILFYSLIGLYNDIFDRNIEMENKELSKQLQNIYKDIDYDFEVEISTALESKFKAPIKHNIEKIYINDREFIIPPGQIDIIFFYNNTLFVIECKNFPFKYNPQAIGNEINKTKTTFSYKLQKKIEFVEDNIELVAALLEIDKDKISMVNGIFITNNFSFASVIEGISYPVINNTELIKWFSKNA